MSLKINTDLASLRAQRDMSYQQKRLSRSFASLSSGKRIVKAADDAAGIAIADNLKNQKIGTKMAKRNAESAMSFLQVGEGALNEITNILTRVRELGIQASSDTFGDTERGYMNQEVQQLVQEVERISQTTSFGDRKLLNGSNDELEFQVGAFAGEEHRITYDSSMNASAGSLGVDDISLSEKGDAQDSLEIVDSALKKVGEFRSHFGATQRRLDSTVSHLGEQYESISAAHSQVADADIAHESAELASAKILQSAAASVLAQANTQGNVALRLIG